MSFSEIDDDEVDSISETYWKQQQRLIDDKNINSEGGKNFILSGRSLLKGLLIRNNIEDEYNSEERLLQDEISEVPTPDEMGIYDPDTIATLSPTMQPTLPTYRETVAKPFGWLFIAILGLIFVVIVWRLCVCWQRLRERRHLMLQSAAADNVLGDMDMVRADSDGEENDIEDEDDELI